HAPIIAMAVPAKQGLYDNSSLAADPSRLMRWRISERLLLASTRFGRHRWSSIGPLDQPECYQASTRSGCSTRTPRRRSVDPLRATSYHTDPASLVPPWR